MSPLENTGEKNKGVFFSVHKATFPHEVRHIKKLGKQKSLIQGHIKYDLFQNLPLHSFSLIFMHVFMQFNNKMYSRYNNDTHYNC